MQMFYVFLNNLLMVIGFDYQLYIKKKVKSKYLY